MSGRVSGSKGEPGRSSAMQRHLVIGDVHGCHEELLDLCERAAVSASDVLVSVGDLVDRGPSPREVVRFFRERPSSIVLMGNHERKHVRQVCSYAQDVTRLQMGEEYESFVAWASTLPYFFETEAARVVHAAMIPGVPLVMQREDVLAGTTSGEAFLDGALGGAAWHELYADEVPVAFGHRVFESGPHVGKNGTYGLDTGACHGHTLTALSLPDFRLYSVPARAEHWSRVKREWQSAVLRARPLATMDFVAIEEELSARGRSADPEVAALVEGAQRWAAACRALMPAIVARVPVLLDELRNEHGPDVAKTLVLHPAKPLLFASLKGRFEGRTVGAHCRSPRATLDLAKSVGLDTAALDLGPWV